MGISVTSMGSQNNRKLELKKHTATIHCSNSLSLLQRKISNALLYHAYHELLVCDIHKISVKQLCNLINYSGHNYDAIKSALRQLVTTCIEWNLVDSEASNESWTASTILASVKLSGSECYYSYSPHMKQLLHTPQMYGVVNLIIQAKFKSNYALALYENCARYQNLSVTKWFDVALFRKLMGVPDDKYIVFRDFKRRVLDKSVEEVNSYSDLTLEPELNRVGRKVSSIRFKISKKPKEHSEIEATSKERKFTDEVEECISKIIDNFQLSRSKAISLVDQYSHGTVMEKINLIKQSEAYRQASIRNLAAYFIKALKDDYQIPKSGVAILSQKKIAKQIEEQRERLIDEENRKRYNEYVNETVDEYISSFTQAKLSQLTDDFLNFLNNNGKKLELQWYRKDKFSHPGVKASLNNYLRKQYPEVDDKICSFEEYTEMADVAI